MKKTIIGFILLSGCTSVTEYPKQIIGTWKTIPSNNDGIQIQKTYNKNGVLETVSTANPNEKHIAKYKINGSNKTAKRVRVGAVHDVNVRIAGEVENPITTKKLNNLLLSS